ncbi:START domain-containing protein [Foetidibacter luteolus]|uniref:START domain-containing protein n=1 Tax=Foetidibacter luteolus TaxID=2608880 RepID=UPI00129BD0EC|nr:START domain-containing protein [Foetidibacter luteolus]
MKAKYAVLLLVATLNFIHVFAQPHWKLKLNKEGIAVYSRSLENSGLKAIKVECTLPASLSQLVAVVMDVNTGAEWVYSTKSSVLLKQVSPGDLYYYSEVSLPWPASNRDFVAHLIAVQDSATKIVTINGPTVPGYIPVKKGIVRVPNSSGKWTITPLQKAMIKVEYVLEVDPGGSIPAWVVNLFAAKGPFETFRNLKQQLKKPAYANIRLPFIQE